MNERIRELLVKADIKFDRDINEIEVCVMLPSDLEKFAELIIDDVMNELFVVYPGGKNGSDVKFQNITARQWINQVFGVER